MEDIEKGQWYLEALETAVYCMDFTLKDVDEDPSQNNLSRLNNYMWCVAYWLEQFTKARGAWDKSFISAFDVVSYT